MADGVTMGGMQALLAVDLGIRTGLAVYDETGRLIRYGSHNFGRAARLRRAVSGVLAEVPELAWLVYEGGGPLAKIWENAAERRGVAVQSVNAERWRAALLYVREQRSGKQAKRVAGGLARRVIEWSGAPRPTALRHDTAEAILVGLWGVLEVGWLGGLPVELRQ